MEDSEATVDQSEPEVQVTSTPSKKRAVKIYLPEEHGAISSDASNSSDDEDAKHPKKKKRVVMTPEEIAYVRACIAPSRERDRKTRNNKHAYLKEVMKRVQSERDSINQAHATEIEMAIERMGRGMATTPGKMRQFLVASLPFLAFGLGTVGLMGAFK